MGFFYSKNAGVKPRSVVKQVVGDDFYRDQGCKACSLNKQSLKNPKMLATGSDKPIIYVVGEAPGAEEDNTGIQFVGKSGKYLRDVLESHFGSISNGAPLAQDFPMRFNNVLRCRPPGNREPSDVEVECCRNFLIKDIEETKPILIMGAGNVPLKWFLKASGIKDLWRGRFIPIKIGKHKMWYAPILHPAFVIRQRKGFGDSEWEKCFDLDIKNIRDFVFQDKHPPPIVIDSNYFDNIDIIEGFESEKDIGRVVKALNRLLGKKMVGLDIENWPLKPWQDKDSRLLSIAIGDEEYTVTYPLEREDAWGGKYDKILDLTYNFIIESGLKVTHTLKHELTWLRKYFGDSVIRETKWGDVKSQAYVIDERFSKKRGMGMFGLGRLTQLNLGFDLKSFSSVDVTDLRTAPMQELLRYNAGDTRWLPRIFNMQDIKMSDSLRDVYERHHVEAAKTLSIVESRGVRVSLEVMSFLEHGKDGRSGWVKKFGEIKDMISARPEVLQYEKLKNKKLNPGSDLQLALIFEEILGLPCKKRTGGKKEGRYSVDKFVLDEFEEEGVCLAPLIREYREFRDLIATYCDGVRKRLDSDNILHTEFNVEVTGTGRLSSENPNLQNWDKRKNPQVRGIVIAE